jgi:hypothetical protein
MRVSPTSSRGRRIVANLAYARTRYREGGTGLVLRRAARKARRLTRTWLGARLAQPAIRMGDTLATARVATAASAPELMRPGFDADWYASFYGLPSDPTADPFDHYVSIGARRGFSPSPAFDEMAYRGAYRDVNSDIELGTMLCGYLHYVLRGKEGRRHPFALADRLKGSADYPMHGDLADAVRAEFEPDWYRDTYDDVARIIAAGGMPSPLWHYITEGVSAGRSPNAWFDEQWYLNTYPDVATAKTDRGMPNGFVHYLRHGRAEGRRTNSNVPATLEDVFVGITRPVGIDRLAMLESVMRPFAHRVYPATGKRRVNFMVPTVDRTLLFGGYIAAFNFIKRLLDRDWAVRLLILDDEGASEKRLRDQFAPDSMCGSVLGRTEIVNLAGRNIELDITPDDSFVAYSMWAAHHADILASAVGRKFVFFVQEFEPTFHSHDALHAIGVSNYQKPHFALFNSELLRRYFLNERVGVFSDGEELGYKQSTVFEHALAIPRPPQADELKRGDQRRLLFYARPEAHAARNLFEIGVGALRRAVEDGVFDGGDWQFDGVGSLATETTVRLGRGRVLNMRPRLALGDYAEALRSYEVGLSLQYAPHPGVVHFEMASSGMAVVTNTFRNRSPDDLRAMSTNLIAVEPTTEALAEALGRATLLARDTEACVAGADGPWPRSWDDSFNDEVMETIEAELT